MLVHPKPTPVWIRSSDEIQMTIVCCNFGKLAVAASMTNRHPFFGRSGDCTWQPDRACSSRRQHTSPRPFRLFPRAPHRFSLRTSIGGLKNLVNSGDRYVIQTQARFSLHRRWKLVEGISVREARWTVPRIATGGGRGSSSCCSRKPSARMSRVGSQVECATVDQAISGQAGSWNLIRSR